MTKVFPEYDRKINGIFIHLPTVNVTALDLTFRTEQPIEYSVVIGTFTQLANSDLKGIVDVTEEELVSKDLVGNPHAATIDVNSGIALNNNFMKIVAW
ncbi:hypothetical protein GJ496_002330 [Pomphorhynchus laevis]|nr:hypothetical protein GJ496_002330 [Pomphorhynchus laevis]